MQAMSGDITEKEIWQAILQLCTRKSPGSDSLTAGFYKHFVDDIAPILTMVFNKEFELGSMSFSQYLVIIILLHKKGP